MNARAVHEGHLAWRWWHIRGMEKAMGGRREREAWKMQSDKSLLSAKVGTLQASWSSSSSGGMPVPPSEQVCINPSQLNSLKHVRRAFYQGKAIHTISYTQPRPFKQAQAYNLP